MTPAIASPTPPQPLAAHPAPLSDAHPVTTSPASAAPTAAPTAPVAPAQPQPAAIGHPAPIIAPTPTPQTPGNLATYGSDMPRAAHTPPTPTISASGGPTPSLQGAAVASSASAPAPSTVSPGMLAGAGAAAAGTGAAIVSSETRDKHLDAAIRLAYELWHASRRYPGVHWCVGVFKFGATIETVVTSNDGAGYIPPGVYLPRSARILFADPMLDNQFQNKWFGWVNPAATMVAYADHRGVSDPNVHLYALAATTDPGGSSVLPARRAGVPHYRDCDSTRSPIPPHEPSPELDATRRHRLSVIDPTALSEIGQKQAWDDTATAVGMAMAAAEPLFVEVAPIVRQVFGALASGAPITDAQWDELEAVRRNGKSLWMRPGYIEMEPSTNAAVTALYRAHHNLDRAAEALVLWRGQPQTYPDIVYAAQQVIREAQLWTLTSSS